MNRKVKTTYSFDSLFALSCFGEIYAFRRHRVIPHGGIWNAGMSLKQSLKSGVEERSFAPQSAGAPAAVAGLTEGVVTGAAVLVVREERAAHMLGLARRTLQDMRLRGDGPPYVALTERRVGYLVSALETWALERSRQSTSAATRIRGAGV